MGKYLRVAKRYDIEWGNTESFSWAHDDFFNVLKALGGSPCYCSGDDDYISDDFECDVEKYDGAIKNLEMYISDPAKLSDELNADDIRKRLETLKMPADKVLGIMRDYRNEADVHTGWMHFSAF